MASVSSSASGKVTIKAAHSWTRLAVRTSQGATKRFWYRVPAVMLSKAPKASRKFRRVDFAQPQLLPHHQGQARRSRAPGRPIAAARYRAAARRDPDGGEHRLQAHQQRHQARAHAQLDRGPHAAQVAGVHQDAGDGQMPDLRCDRRGQRRARGAGPDGEAGDRESVAHRQELHRRRMRHAVARHDEAGAPDQHEDGGHRRAPGGPAVTPAVIGYFTRLRISGRAFCR